MKNRYDLSALGADHVAVFAVETTVPGQQPGEGGFARWPWHQPVQASVLIAKREGERDWQFQFDSLEMTTGQEGAFLERLEALLSRCGVLVTAGGRAFDLFNLALTAMAAQRFELPQLSRFARANPYDLIHADVCDLFSNFGSAPKLALGEICGALAIPVEVDMHGIDPADMIAAGDMERLKRHSAADVAATYAAWLHWSAMASGDDAAIALPLSQFARWIAREPALAHLLPIAQCPSVRWARGRAIQLRLGAARQDIQQQIAFSFARKAQSN